MEDIIKNSEFNQAERWALTKQNVSDMITIQIVTMDGTNKEASI